MTGSVMGKVNDELLAGLIQEADDLKKGLANGKFADMQSLLRAMSRVASASAHVLGAMAGEGVVTADECREHRKSYGNNWKSAAVYCAAALGALVALLQFITG